MSAIALLRQENAWNADHARPRQILAILQSLIQARYPQVQVTPADAPPYLILSLTTPPQPRFPDAQLHARCQLDMLELARSRDLDQELGRHIQLLRHKLRLQAQARLKRLVKYSP